MNYIFLQSMCFTKVSRGLLIRWYSLTPQTKAHLITISPESIIFMNVIYSGGMENVLRVFRPFLHLNPKRIAERTLLYFMYLTWCTPTNNNTPGHLGYMMCASMYAGMVPKRREVIASQCNAETTTSIRA